MNLGFSGSLSIGVIAQHSIHVATVESAKKLLEQCIVFAQSEKMETVALIGGQVHTVHV